MVYLRIVIVVLLYLGRPISASKQDLNEANKKCVPLLDRQTLSSSFNKPGQLGLAPDANIFSFKVADIDLPLASADSSIQSAMRLLSTFSSQLDPIMRDEEEVEDEDEPEDREEKDREKRLNVVKFRDNNLHLSGLNLTMLNVHLYADDCNDPKFGIGITIKNTTLDGRFTYRGPLVPLTSSNSLKGYYSMSIDNIYLLITSNLTKVDHDSTKNHLAQQQHLKTNGFSLNVTNLGYISIDIYDPKVDSMDNVNNHSFVGSRQPTSNYVLKMLQKLLQKTVKRTYLTFEHHIKQALELQGRRILDCELSRFDDLLQINSTSGQVTSANKQGVLARVLDREIVQSNFSRVDLPNFDHQQSVFGSTARISFYNGSLSGLNTIKMIGETRIKLQDHHLIMNASLGWRELKPYYTWNLTLGAASNSTKAPVSQGFVSFQINDFDFDAVITKGLQDEEGHQQAGKIMVERLVIRNMGTPKMDIGGLPGMNRLTRAMVNFFMGRLKLRLTGAIQPILKQQLERSLNKLLL